MGNYLAQLTLVVKEYDEAIAFYTQKLHFDLIEDTVLSATKRWVVVASKNGQCRLLLAKAATAEQEKYIGNQTGGRVFLFMNTDQFEIEYQNLIQHQIEIVRQPRIESYGTVAVFKDLYGNLWDLIAPNKPEKEHYFSTAILKRKPEKKEDELLQELKKLQYQTQQEKGNFLFELYIDRTNSEQIIVWEGFYSEIDFQNHLKSKHLCDFLNQDLVDFVSGYPAKKLF